MYKTIITLKDTLSSEELSAARDAAAKAFDNREGHLLDKGNSSHELVFEGEERYYGCLDLGMLALKEMEGFVDRVLTWEWIDEDPDESCDMLEVFSRYPIHCGTGEKTDRGEETYKTIIVLKETLSGEELNAVRDVIIQAFDNRIGRINNSGVSSHELIFEGDGDFGYACLEVGIFDLREIEGFLDFVSAWEWIDDDPDESCSMLDVFARYPL